MSIRNLIGAALVVLTLFGSPYSAKAAGTDLTALASCKGYYTFENGALTSDGCGGDDTFTNSNVSGNTSWFVDGAQSATFARSPLAYMGCMDASCPNLDLAGANQQFSICATLNPTELAAGVSHTIYAKDNNTSQISQRGIFFNLAYTGGVDKLRITLAPADCTSAVTTLTGATTISTTNQPYYVCATYDDTNLKLWLNGAEDATTALTTGVCGNAIDATIGARTDTNNTPPVQNFSSFVGSIDDLIIANTGYTAANVCSYCRTGAKGQIADRGTGACNSCSFGGATPTATASTTPTPTVTATPTPTLTAQGTATTAPTPTATATPDSTKIVWIDDNGADTFTCGTSAFPCRTWNYMMTSTNRCGTPNCQTNVGAGWQVRFKAGTYTDKLTIPFDGTSNAPFEITCEDYPAQQCILDYSGTSFPSGACIWFGLTPGGSGNQSTYGRLTKFTIRGGCTGAVALISNNGFGTASSTNITVAQNTITSDGVEVYQTDSGEYINFKDNTLTCWSGSATGCFFGYLERGVSFIGNTITVTGPTAGVNAEAIGIYNTRGALIDGNTILSSTSDGIDVGQNLGPTSVRSHGMSNILVRYNDVMDARARPLTQSADCGAALCDSSTFGGINVWHSNLAHQGPLGQNGGDQNYSGANDVNWWQTAHIQVGNGYGGTFWYQNQQESPLIQGAQLRYNLFAGLQTGVGSPYDLPILLGVTFAQTIGGCGAGHRCPQVKNTYWYPNKTNNPCIYWQPIDGTAETFACSVAGINAFNISQAGGSNQGHSGNKYQNPQLVNINSPASTANLQLTAGSPLIDAVDTTFCQRNGGATSGNTITVTCNGTSTDPRYYFKQPSDFWDVGNDDCKNRGLRLYSNVNPGCYDIQIDGCVGVRQVVSMTDTTITVGGPSCTWSGTERVHAPWAGNAPDAYPLEYGAVTSPIPTPTPTATSTVAPTATVAPTPVPTSTSNPTDTPGPTVTPAYTGGAAPTSGCRLVPKLPNTRYRCSGVNY